MEDEKQLYTIILRHDTSTMWLSNDPILALGEYGVEDDTHKVKRGNGESKWSELVYEDFGLQYIVTYANLHGEITDNELLTEMFGSKISLSVFEDVGNKVVTGMKVEEDKYKDGNYIALVSRTMKDVNSLATITNNLIIKSEDNTIQGYWSVDSQGQRILNLIAVCSINDYIPQHKYYRNQLCYFNNKLWRAYADIDSSKSFNENQWTLVCSLHAKDIKFDNVQSTLDADNVQDALDELKRRDDKKLPKSTEPYSVYGTTDLGKQRMIPIDNLRKVDTVNRKQADLNKNVQLDAGEINYSDAHPEYGSIRKVLDEKVDKNFAGEGAKIVRDVQFNYNEETGAIELIEDKVSPKDGSSAQEKREIDVVSEKELADKAEEINDRITNEVSTLNTRISKEVNELTDAMVTMHNEQDQRITDEVATLNDRMDTEVHTLNGRITDEVNDLVRTITEVANDLSDTIETNKQQINTRVDNEVKTLNDGVTKEVNDLTDLTLQLHNKQEDEIQTLDAKVDRIKEETDQTIADNKVDIEQKLADKDAEINERIDNEVETLNNTIDTNKQEINNRVTKEVNDLTDLTLQLHNEQDERITNEVETLNNTITAKDTAIHNNVDQIKEETDQTIADNKADIEDKLQKGLDKKINKSITTNLLIDIMAAQQSQEPTLKMIRANTETEEQIVNHLHFKAIGDIETKFMDADHIAIDSTVIDEKIVDDRRRITNTENRLDAHDTDIATLFEHDIVHDTRIASNSAQIANHETRVLKNEQDIIQLNEDLNDLDVKYDGLVTDLKQEDTRLSGLIADQAIILANHTNQIRTNADNITEVNVRLTEAVNSLINDKVEKTFAETTDDLVVGKVVSDTITGNEILSLTQTRISPKDDVESEVKTLKVISSDNTVVAKQLADGTIDIATNLDTDVNYFVTTEILSTTIPSETTVSLDSLTSTDKEDVEIQDIISDSEGTWARVKSIDTDEGTCVVVTFHKHAQAVWGTVKGNIAEQQDLQIALGNKISRNEMNYITTDVSFGHEWVDDKKTIVIAKHQYDTSNKSISKEVERVLGSSEDIIVGKQILGYGFTLSVNGENVVFDKVDSILTSTKLAPAIRELAGIVNTNKTNIETTLAEGLETLQENINTVASNLTTETTNRTNADSTLQTNIDNVDNAKVDKVSGANKVYGTDEDGNQTSYDKDSFGKVDTVNGVEADNNKNVKITAEDIELSDTNSETVGMRLSETANSLDALMNEFKTQITEYHSDTHYTPTGSWITQKFVTFEREDGILLMAKIKKDFTACTTGVTEYDNFMNDVEAGNLKLVGIPEQVGGGAPTPTYETTGDVKDAVIDIDGIVFAVSHTSAEGEYGIKYIDIYNTISENTAVTTDTWDMGINIIPVSDKTLAVNEDDTLNATEIDRAYVISNFEIQSESAYRMSVMNVLNEIDGGSDTYTELGGTETEIGEILDEILGEN